jgi:hypothetical protein
MIFGLVRRLFRLALYFFIVVVVVVAAIIFLRNTLTKEFIESRLRSRTGMDVRIGQVDVGLLSHSITVENLKLYNTPEFGGSLFLDMPELHLEFDAPAFRSGTLHLKLVRLDIAEISVVQDKKGRYNMKEAERNSHDASPHKDKHDNGMKFAGIDTLNLTLGKFLLCNMATGRKEEIEFGIKDQISRNVKSFADLQSLNVLLYAETGILSTSTNTPLDISGLVKSLTEH